MLGALVIVFREAIEAGLIIGIVLAATRGVTNRGAWVGLGVGHAVIEQLLERLAVDSGEQVHVVVQPVGEGPACPGTTGGRGWLR